MKTENDDIMNIIKQYNHMKEGVDIYLPDTFIMYDIWLQSTFLLVSESGNIIIIKLTNQMSVRNTYTTTTAGP